LEPLADDAATLQRIAELWEPVFRGREADYFNLLAGQRREHKRPPGAGKQEP
jgi:hypothetical protein